MSERVPPPARNRRRTPAASLWPLKAWAKNTCRCPSASGSSGSSLMPTTTTSSGASTQLPVGASTAPASTYAAGSKARCGDSSTVTRNPASTSRATSDGTTGARRSVGRTSALTQRCVAAREGSVNPYALADRGDPALADGQSAPAVLVVVHPDQRAVADDHVLVGDDVAHHGALADPDVVEEDRALHAGGVLHVDVEPEDRGVHRGAGDDRAGSHDGVTHGRAGHELRAGQLVVRGEDRPPVVVEDEDRQRRHQVQVRLVVAVDRPHVPPVVPVTLARAGHRVALEVVDRDRKSVV